MLCNQIESSFASGELVRPNWRQPSLVDLVRALAFLSGITDIEQTDPTRDLIRVIGPSDHLIFVLIDGMGMNLIERLPERSLIRSHLVREIQSLFPTTTAAALTSVATGQWPNRHAVTGWWTYLAERGISTTILPFVDRFTHRPLTEEGLTAEKVFPCHALHPRMTHEPLSVLPGKLPNTVYSVYSRGGTPGSGYWAIDAAIDQIIDRITQARKPTYTYFYISDVDTLGHLRGWDHEDTIALLTWIDDQLGRLCESVCKRARIVISSDHGQTVIRLRDRLPLYEGDPLLEMLQAPPSGNPPTPMFHVKKGRRTNFVHMFEDRFSEHFCLVSSDEAEALELTGPGKMSQLAKSRFGHFIGIARGPFTLKYYERGRIPAADDLGGHSGLTSAEMRIGLAMV